MRMKLNFGAEVKMESVEAIDPRRKVELGGIVALDWLRLRARPKGVCL